MKHNRKHDDDNTLLICNANSSKHCEQARFFLLCSPPPLPASRSRLPRSASPAQFTAFVEAVAIEFRKQAQPEWNTVVGLIGSGNKIIQVLFYILSHTCIIIQKRRTSVSDVKKQEATIDVLVSSG